MIDFLKTGELGPMFLGFTPGEVVARIGEPISIGCESRDRNDCVFLYGDTALVNLQLGCFGGVLEWIGMHFMGSDDFSTLPEWLMVSDCPVRGTMTMNSFYALAEAEGLPWRLDLRATDEDFTSLLIPFPCSSIQIIWRHAPEQLDKVVLGRLWKR